MGQLRYLLLEVCAGVEIFFTGRSGSVYLKTAFILCDDYTELASKLFLLTDDPKWSDKDKHGRFKKYHTVLNDVRGVISAKRAADLPKLNTLQAEMKNRRRSRNDFFHSANLLNLNVAAHNCVEAYCDLLDYGHLLLVKNGWMRLMERVTSTP
jgi:hypothetical protein